MLCGGGYWSGVLAAIAVSSCAAGSGEESFSRLAGITVPTEAPSPKAVVVVDMFSGRPNPTWEPTEIESSQLSALFDGLETASNGQSQPAPGLGLRGFKVKGLPTGKFAGASLDVRPASVVVVDIDAVSYTHLTLPTILRV